MRKQTLKNKIIENKAVRNIFSCLVILLGGFILLNIAFLFDALYQGILRWIVGLFIPLDPEMNIYWFPQFMHGSFVVVICLISWFVFKTKLKPIYKAIFTTVPLAAIYLTIGMFFHHLPIASYLIGALFGLGVLYYLYKNKLPWIYYFTLIFISVLIILVVLLGIEI